MFLLECVRIADEGRVELDGNGRGAGLLFVEALLQNLDVLEQDRVAAVVRAARVAEHGIKRMQNLVVTEVDHTKKY